MLGKKRKPTKPSETTFLVKLYTILQDDAYSQYIHWSPEGLSVIISDPNGFTKKVLPNFFNHHNFSSFVRQLNMYNFHKVKTDKKGEQKYMHNEFNELKSMRDIKSIKKKIKTDENDNSTCKTKYILEKKIGGINKNENKEHLEQIEKLDEESKLKEFENIIQKGDLSNLSNEKILSYLLDKSKENIDNKRYIENEINNLIKQNNILVDQLQICNNKLLLQKENSNKMKGMIIYLITLLINKIQENKIENKKKLFNDFIIKCSNYIKNKKNIKNQNLIIKSIDKDKDLTLNSYNNSIIQRPENFTINQNIFEYNHNDNDFLNMSNYKSINLDLRNSQNRYNSNYYLNSNNCSNINLNGTNLLFNSYRHNN